MGTVNPNPVNPAGIAGAAGGMGRCQVCGNMRQTSAVKFHHNIGMIVLRQTRSIQGSMCKTCMRSKHWEYMGKNLLPGAVGDYFNHRNADLYGYEHGDVCLRCAQAERCGRVRAAASRGCAVRCCFRHDICPTHS